MKNLIKKQNETHALRVFTISKQAIMNIEKLENEVISKNIADPGIYQLIEGYKKEIDTLCQKYLDHLEECTEDKIAVDKELIDGYKLSTETMIMQLQKYSEALKSESSHPRLPDGSFSSHIAPDYLI